MALGLGFNSDDDLPIATVTMIVFLSFVRQETTGREEHRFFPNGTFESAGCDPRASAAN